MNKRFAMRGPGRPSSFTLIEVLAVIAIIAILAGLSLAALSGAYKRSLRSRAAAEIQGMAGALENYKADNGGYPTPTVTIFTSTNSYMTYASGSPLYLASGQLLYQNLTGTTNFGDLPPTPSTSAMKIYMTFKRTQLGNDTSGGGLIYVQDPFGNPYGYFNGNGANLPYNGTNQFDLWSTSGDTNNPPVSIVKWQGNWGT